MSKRKKSYDKINDDNNYYNNRMLDLNNQYFNNYPNMAINNVQDVFKNGFNLNNIFEFLNSIDFRNLNAIIGLMSDGLDINNINFGNFNNNEETYKNYTNQSTYNNEMVINFFNSLKQGQIFWGVTILPPLKKNLVLEIC